MGQTMIYAFSSAGTTTKAANILKNYLGDAFVEENPSKISSGFSAYVLGTNVQYGKFHRRLKRFLKKNEETLKDSFVYLFLVGARSEEAEKYISRARKLVPYAVDVRFVWGELNLTGGPLRKFMIKCLIEGRRDDRLPKPRLLDKELRALAENILSRKF